MSLSIVNWNVRWATPKSRRTAEILGRIDQHFPDVVCLTETHDELPSRHGHTICSQPDYGYTVKPESPEGPALVEGNPGLRSMMWGSTRCRRDGLCRA